MQPRKSSHRVAADNNGHEAAEDAVTGAQNNYDTLTNCNKVENDKI